MDYTRIYKQKVAGCLHDKTILLPASHLQELLHINISYMHTNV